ncbi:MAG: transcription termination/antitermination protein NusG [Bacteroidales bacterium]|jgi:transcriptional antiterminator NusG|nr:transcription termination/antitermination protein NusG [Bacteroidales bacterium]
MFVEHIEGTGEEQLDTVENPLKWYVLKTIRGHEKKIKALLETRIETTKLQDAVPRILLPTEKVFHIRNGKKISKEKTCYSGYIFVEADLSQGEAKYVLRSTPGVLGFLGGEESPEPLKEQEALRLMGVIDEMEDPIEATGTFSKGTAIKVIDGPFNSFEGEIEEVDTERKKLKVTVKIFGRKTPLELHFSQVEKLS